jgi:hypothetical protein
LGHFEHEISSYAGSRWNALSPGLGYLVNLGGYAIDDVTVTGCAPISLTLGKDGQHRFFHLRQWFVYQRSAVNVLLLRV